MELAKKIFDELTGLTALLVGAGEMAELAAEHLLSGGVKTMLVANRTLARAVELSTRLGGGGAYALEDLPQALALADIVVSSTGASAAVITPELTRRILQRRPEACILAFSMHRDPLFAAQAIRAGALGYVTKSSSPDVLIQAVYKVARREKVLSPDIAPEMALTLLEGVSNPADELNPREFEILRLLLDGMGPEEIGSTLNISPKTVQNAHHQIKTKLGVRTDIELARLAMKLKLIG